QPLRRTYAVPLRVEVIHTAARGYRVHFFEHLSNEFSSLARIELYKELQKIMQVRAARQLLHFRRLAFAEFDIAVCNGCLRDLVSKRRHGRHVDSISLLGR